MITAISGALAPSIALLSFVYLKDKYELEPLKIIIKLFILGVFLVFPAYVLERTFQEGLSQYFWYNNLFNIALIEEFLKWFTLYFMIFKHVEFNEPYDGVVYSTSIAVGFATIENIGYVLFQQLTPTYILLRALLPVSSHAIFGIIMGYFLGRSKFSLRKRRYFIWLSFILPILLHAAYNFILHQHFTNWMYLMLPFIGSVWIYGLHKIKVANNLSPLRIK